MPDGGLRHIPEENWGAAQTRGWRFQTPEEQDRFAAQLKYGSRPIAAAAAGAARALTLNTSDLALTATGAVEPETLRGLKEHNVGATTAGEIGGTILGLAAGDEFATGPSALAELGRVGESAALPLLGEGALARIGAKAAGGTLEGLAMGVANVVDEKALGDPDLNGEKAAATLGLSGLLGAAGGGFGGAVGEAVDAARPGIAQATSGLADRTALKAAGFIGKDFKAAGFRGITEDLAQTMREEGLLAGAPTVGDVADRAEAKVSEWGAKKGALIDFVDDKASPMVDGAEIAKRVRGEVIRPLLGGNAADQAVAARLEKDAAILEAKGDMSFEQAELHKRSFDPYLKFNAEASPVQDGLRSIRRIIKEDVENKVEAIGNSIKPGLGDEFLEAKKKYGLLKEIAKVSRARSDFLAGSNSFGLGDKLAGLGLGALAGGPMGLVTGALGAVANKLARERGPAIAARLLGQISDSPAMSMMAGSFAKAASGAASSGALGVYGPILLNAIAKGPAESYLTHIALSNGDAKYAESMAAAGFPRPGVDERQPLFDKAHHLAALGSVFDGHEDRLHSDVGRAIRGGAKPTAAAPKQDFGGRRMRVDSEAAHERHAEEIIRFAANPEALASRVGVNLRSVAAHAPITAAVASATAARAVAHLVSKLKRPVPALLQSAPGSSAAERELFARHREVATDPHAILRHIAAGTLTAQHMETARVVYPRLTDHMARLAIERLVDRPKVPYRSRVGLALLTGMDLDGTMGVTIAANQAAVAAETQKPSQAGPGGPAGLGELTLGERTRQPRGPREQPEV